MKLMYPHPVDRYRIIQKILKMERERYDDGQRGIGQTAVAERAGVSQATISNIENLERSVDNQKRRISREELLKVMTNGLNLQQEKIDAILWLFDGEPLFAEEIRRYVSGYLTAASLVRNSFKDLRGTVLDYLEELLQHYSTMAGRTTGLNKIITAGHEQANLAAVKELIAVERIPGQRMLIMQNPSYLTRSPDAYWSGESSPRSISENICSEFSSLNRLRIQNLASYGERCIHHKGSLDDYIKNGAAHLTVDERRNQIRQWIDLLEAPENEYYELRLTETIPGLEINIKSSVATMIGTWTNEEPPWKLTGWKALWIMLIDEATTLFFLLAFERQWDNLSKKYSSKSEVIAYLRNICDRSSS